MPNQNARELRKNMTDAEQALWRLLRQRQIKVFGFVGKCRLTATSPTSRAWKPDWSLRLMADSIRNPRQTKGAMRTFDHRASRTTVLE